MFLKKKHFSFFFEKRNVFLEIFFRKQFFQNFQNISAHKTFVKVFFIFFRKKISKKNIFFKKKEKCFFSKK